VAGVIVMAIDGRGYKHAQFNKVAVLINVDKVAREVTVSDLRGRMFAVHKVQRKSEADPLARTAAYNRATGAFSIPPRTTVVFVEHAPVPLGFN
jgi:hypothetical protein